ncbi:MAG: ParB N-terminal domain-containing protein [Prolixibacteraceae bacterium]
MTKTNETLESAPSTVVPKQATKREIEEQDFARVEAIKTASKEIPKFKPRPTFLISNYTDFELISSNREIVPNPRLKQDLEKFGQLDPIAVKKDGSGKFLVLNGQHRLHYLKELGLPVECIELKEDSSGTNFDVIKSLNVKGRSWTKENYSSHYIKEENSNYREFRRLKCNYPSLSESIIYKFVNGKTGKLRSDYENGTLKFEPTKEQEASLTIFNELIGLIGSSRKEHSNKTYFDKPQIVDLLFKFTQENDEIDLSILKKAMREEGDTLNKESTLSQIEKLYSKFKIK